MCLPKDAQVADACCIKAGINVQKCVRPLGHRIRASSRVYGAPHVAVGGKIAGAVEGLLQDR